MPRKLLQPSLAHSTFLCSEVFLQGTRVRYQTSHFLRRQLDSELWCVHSLSLHGVLKTLSIPQDMPRILSHS